jgi:hypothetical protein
MTIYTDVDARPRIAPKIMGSSLRHRRLVIAGYVAFDPIALARPSMRPREIALLSSLLRRTKHMVEFGAGGSTTLSLKLGVSHLLSVESDAEWISRILVDDAAARAHEDGRLKLLHADIGLIGFLGGPGKASDRSKWPSYSRTPWAHLGDHALDLILIDGRFRVACILDSLLRVDRHTVLAVHDFWNRPAYHIVLPFLDEIDRCESLGLFRVRRELDRTAAEALLKEAAYWPG